MMFKKYVVFGALLLVALAGFSQAKMKVESFKELSNDMDARIHHRVEDTGVMGGADAPLIKIVASNPVKFNDFEFDGGTAGIVKTEEKLGEIWVYPSVGAIRITIKHRHFGVLRLYEYPTGPLQEGAVYEMRLTVGKVTTIINETVNTQWAIIDSDPEGATVFLNNVNTGEQTPFQRELMPGEYEFKLEKANYKTYLGKFELTGDEKKRIQAELAPNFADIEIVVEPPGLKNAVTIDGVKQGRAAPFTARLSEGDHVVGIDHPKYYPVKRAVTVVAQQDGDQKFVLRPRTGTLRIVANVIDAEIVLTDDEGNVSRHTAPVTIRDALIGDYQISISKEGYQTHTARATVMENETASVKEKMVKIPRKQPTIYDTGTATTDTEVEENKPPPPKREKTGLKIVLEGGGYVYEKNDEPKISYTTSGTMLYRGRKFALGGGAVYYLPPEDEEWIIFPMADLKIYPNGMSSGFVGFRAGGIDEKNRFGEINLGTGLKGLYISMHLQYNQRSIMENNYNKDIQQLFFGVRLGLVL